MRTEGVEVHLTFFRNRHDDTCLIIVITYKKNESSSIKMFKKELFRKLAGTLVVCKRI